MLERAKPELVVIATPPHLHRAIAVRALASGAHVLCEKPLAMTRAEAEAMMDAARRAGRVGMTCFNWRFAAAMQELHSRVTEGALGRVFHLALRWFGSRWADEKAAATWRMDRAQAGHGAMGDMGVHLVDLVRWTFGEFRRVSAHTGIAYPSRSAPGVSRPPDAEDYCTVLGELDSGAQVTLTARRAARGAVGSRSRSDVPPLLARQPEFQRYNPTSQPAKPPASTTTTGGSQRAARTTVAAVATAVVTQSCTAARASVYTPAAIRPMPTGASARSAASAHGRPRSRSHRRATTAASNEVGRNMATPATRAPTKPWAR